MMAGAGILSQEALQTIGKLSRPNALWDKDEGEVFLLNKIYEDYIREKVHEQLIGMAKRMLEDDILSLEKIAEYSGLELAEAENAVRALGGRVDRIESPSADGLDFDHRIIVISKEKNTMSKFPRKAGTPSKEPIK